MPYAGILSQFLYKMQGEPIFLLALSKCRFLRAKAAIEKQEVLFMLPAIHLGVIVLFLADVYKRQVRCSAPS